MLTEMRKTLSRRVIAEMTNLTQAKIANIEKGRDTTLTEELAIRNAYEQQGSPTSDPAAATSPATVVKPPEPSLQQMYIMHQNKLRDPTTGDLLGVADPVELEPAEPVTLISPSDLSARDGARRISSSELASFKRCRRQWWLTYYRGLKPIRESPLGPRAIGDRIHRALQLYYVPDGQPRTEPKAALERVIQEDWLAVKAAFAAQGEEVPELLVIDLNKQADLERAMIEGYVEWLAETGADSEFKVIGSERYVEADLMTRGTQVIKLIGRLDVQVRRIFDNLPFFLDHKTMGEFVTATRLLPMNEQMKMYVLLHTLASDPGNPRIVGAIYNMIRRVKRTGNAKPPFYQRVEVQHNPTEIQTFKDRTIGVIGHMESARLVLDAGGDHHRVVYPTPTKDCAWQCPFAQVCTLFDDGSRVEAALEGNFVVGDPYDYYAAPAEVFGEYVVG
jgi:hypothetical protein